MNSKSGVQSKRRCESHESYICIVGFPACKCQKKSIVYEMECTHAAVHAVYFIVLPTGGALQTHISIY